MSDITLIDCLYEELVILDEQAGEFDEFTNARVEDQRRTLVRQIRELEGSAV
jgi:hypothetical protein